MEVNEGPLHDHPVFTWLPSLLVPNKVRGNPAHTGALLDASASGGGFTARLTVDDFVQPVELCVTTTVYA